MYFAHEQLRELLHAASADGLSGACVLVLQVMALTTARDGTTHVSVREIGRTLNRGPGIVHKHIKRLRAHGWIEQVRRHQVDHRHRVWRVAGMSRTVDALRDARRAVENLQEADATSRAGGARSPDEVLVDDATSRAGGARSDPGAIPLFQGSLENARATEPPDPGQPVGDVRSVITGIRERLRVADPPIARQNARGAPPSTPPDGQHPTSPPGTAAGVVAPGRRPDPRFTTDRDGYRVVDLPDLSGWSPPRPSDPDTDPP